MTDDALIDAEVDRQRLRAHAASASFAALAGVLMAALILWAVAWSIAPWPLALWLPLLAVVIAMRSSLPALHRRGEVTALASSGDGAARVRWQLRQYRAVVMAHGLVWGSVAWLPASLADPQLQASLIVLLVGLAVGGATLTLFDGVAALLFAVPALLPLPLRMLADDAPLPRSSVVAGAIAVLLLGLLGLAGRRAERQRRELEATRQAERRALVAIEASRSEATELQRRLALVFESTEQGFWFIDNEQRTTDANPAMCRLLGLDHAQLIGRSIYDFVDAANRAVFELHSAQRRAGRANGYEVTLTRADGAPVHCFNNATPVFDRDGCRIGALGLFSDISAQKRVEQQLREASALLAQKTAVLALTLDSLSQGVLNVDAGGRCVAWNQRLIELLQLPPALMASRPRLDELVAYQVANGDFGVGFDRMDDDGRQRLHQALRGEAPAFGHRYRRTRADGTVLEVASHFAADGSLVRTFTDITAAVAAQAALVAARDEAERARESAEAASRAKSDFLSRMSHELRTPLNAVLGFGQLLLADVDDPPSAGQGQRLDELLRGARHLLALINDVLDVARIEAGNLQLTLEAVNLACLARDCARLVQPMAQAREVSLVLQFDPPAAGWQVRADATRLRQVLLNLLSNAIKFNREAGEVRVVGRRRADGLVVEIADQGPGIPAEHQSRLFQAFDRLDRDGAIEGTGIGLALSRSLVELMHGEVGVRSAPGQGSVFWVWLPRCEDGVAVPAAPVAAGPAGGPPRRRDVLYIEDNEVNQLLMQGMLAHRPAIDLRLAGLPEDGLAMAAARPPDLVLLDIQLPGIDGFEVLRRMRALPALRHTPVIAVSANAMPDDLAVAQRAGFSDYLTKPVDLPRLLALVDRTLAESAE